MGLSRKRVNLFHDRVQCCVRVDVYIYIEQEAPRKDDMVRKREKTREVMHSTDVVLIGHGRH
jgi:hypothetical protein